MVTALVLGYDTSAAAVHTSWRWLYASTMMSPSLSIRYVFETNIQPASMVTASWIFNVAKRSASCRMESRFLVYAGATPRFSRNGSTSANWESSWSRTSQKLHHWVLLWDLIAMPVRIFHFSFQLDFLRRSRSTTDQIHLAEVCQNAARHCLRNVMNRWCQIVVET